MGFQDTTHGGIIFSLLDDVMANWLFLKGKPVRQQNAIFAIKIPCIQEKQFCSRAII